MWRALLLAGLILTGGAGFAAACEDSDHMQGIVYDAVPASAPASALVLEVEFDVAVIDAWRGGTIEARVLRVVQGDYEGNSVRVGVGESSCDYPFIFGIRGLIIGEMRDGYRVYTVQTSGGPSELRFGYEGLWFAPIRESVQRRRERTGVDDRRIDVVTPIIPPERATGDFDGDGDADDVGFYENDQGNLLIAVKRAATEDMDVIWGADISSLPRFSFSVAPPGTYHTACELYGGCPPHVPEQVTLTHDGIFVHEVDRANDLLYYWDGATFQDILVAE